MTRDEIIKLAREAGAKPGIENEADAEFLERFASLVASKEREECAKVCDEFYSIEGIAQDCAAAIRARGMK